MRDEGRRPHGALRRPPARDGARTLSPPRSSRSGKVCAA